MKRILLNIAAFFLWNGPACRCGSDPGKAARRAAERHSQQVDQGVSQVNEAFSGYTPSFYEDRAKAYLTAATPQLQQQYAGARNALAAKLSNQGLYNSTAGMRLGDSLSREFTTQSQNLADQSQASADALRQQVENYRNTAIQQVQSAASPLAISPSLVSSATRFQAPSAAPVLSNMFGDWMNQYLLANLNSMGSKSAQGAGSGLYDIPAGWSGGKEESMFTV